ncbi:MBL fold metallo-hydrolase [Rhizosaccharibacter radicis]|uniref:MBL fold metallo-hydrolase n=1 Tax=Rhizosaccharibacter radicis TaxID=2782605 RepID=A0ABT1VZ81_9PROT|nr:MBL fold metallo-hydrolase [Acetobacteraceae bacterium KSS12]
MAASDPAQILRTAEGQVPGVHRWRVGAITITAIADGYAPLPMAVVPQADPAVATELARKFYAPEDHLQCVINTFVIQTPTRRIMVDTGFGALGAGHSGKIWENLRAAGIDPGSIDVLYITHGHPDHTSGMLAIDGSAGFPNAELFIHQNEVAYWGDEAQASRAPEEQKSWFDIFRRSVAAYRGRTTLIDRDGLEIVPGLRVRELFGHTPGHSGLHIADGGEQHLFWTDIVHFQHLQFPRPDWGVGFDADPAQAIKVRSAMLDEVSTDRMTISGTHLVFPGFGHVRREGDAYAFEAARWNYES